MKLKKSADKKLSGVCAGLAAYFGWDVTLTRAIYACLTLFTAGFPGVILYIVLMIIMPDSDK